MKLALVHEWLTNMAGSERVLAAMHELWPDAPVYTSVYAPVALPPELGPDRLRVVSSFLQHVPGARTHWRWLLPLMPAAFESFDLADFDVVLSNCHQCAKGVLTPVDTCHICYCYTPIRYAWEMPARYLAEAGAAGRLVLPGVLRRLRVWDYTAAQRPDHLLAISHFVRRRIAKHYRRDSTVLYPPVDTARFAPAAQREDFYLIVSRLVGYKRVDLAAAALSALGRPLKIVGTGPETERVRQAAGPSVELLGWRSDDEVRDLYARARGLIFPGVEDFGLTPVEAQASGCPVIAFGRGGATETVVADETGVFFAEPTTASLSQAVARFEALTFDPERCRANARRFDLAAFSAQLTAFVDNAWAEHLARAGR
jgi:glycosyltransferase involved in cell wall biosynthesis